MRGAAPLLLTAAAIAVAAGCGGGKTPSPAELGLEREDLIAVARAFKMAEGPVDREVASAKLAWPLVVNGLPTSISPAFRTPIAAAAENAAKIRLPTLLEEKPAASLTGPASPLAGIFRTFTGLTTRGWALIGAALEQIEHGSPKSARFARENVALYIESVYDGHFALGQIDKKLLAGYRKLGGPAVFGGTLTQGEVDALTNFYSEATSRLHPHVGVRLGS